jgi:hypothetical protein
MFGNLLGGLAFGALNVLGGQNANRTNMQISNAQMAFQEGQSEEARQFGREMVGRQEDFQRDMSSTAYQRAMTDMREAGLNPMLAYAQGGASTPMGASAASPAMSGASTRVENVLGPAVSSAMQGAKVITELEQLAAQVQQTQAQTEATNAQANLANTQAYESAARTVTEYERPELVRADRLLRDAQRGNTEAQTATERYRPGYVHAQTGVAQQSAYGQSLENERFRKYGPRGPLQNLGASAEAVGSRIREGVRAQPSPSVSPQAESAARLLRESNVLAPLWRLLR